MDKESPKSEDFHAWSFDLGFLVGGVPSSAGRYDGWAAHKSKHHRMVGVYFWTFWAPNLVFDCCILAVDWNLKHGAKSTFGSTEGIHADGRRKKSLWRYLENGGDKESNFVYIILIIFISFNCITRCPPFRCVLESEHHAERMFFSWTEHASPKTCGGTFALRSRHMDGTIYYSVCWGRPCMFMGAVLSCFINLIMCCAAKKQWFPFFVECWWAFHLSFLRAHRNKRNRLICKCPQTFDMGETQADLSAFLLWHEQGRICNYSNIFKLYLCWHTLEKIW